MNDYDAFKEIASRVLVESSARTVHDAIDRTSRDQPDAHWLFEVMLRMSWAGGLVQRMNEPSDG